MKIGLFFGSFNPIHVGHLIVANIMATTTDLSEVWFVVSPQNPFKKNKSLLHEFDRFDMVEKAITDNPKLKVSDIELKMPKPSYTIDTLLVIQEKYPQKEFVLIIGEDNLAQFPNWKEYQKILDKFSLYVYPRPNSVKSPLKKHSKVKYIDSPSMSISATFIRTCLKEGKSIKYMVPEVVEEYIAKKKFYY